MAEYNSPLDIYEIQGTIGKGGGGTVFKAFHKRLQKPVVIKKIHDYINENEQRNEVDVLKNLRHSYIPQVLDFFVVDGVAYTVMDFIEGESFQSLLDRGVKFRESQVIKYGKQLCEAVQYLHSREIPVIHGDIKPDNIILTPTDDICLIDFNISGISEGNKAYTTGYSKGYSAPEQIEAYNRIAGQLAAASSNSTPQPQVQPQLQYQPQIQQQPQLQYHPQVQPQPQPQAYQTPVQSGGTEVLYGQPMQQNNPAQPIPVQQSVPVQQVPMQQPMQGRDGTVILNVQNAPAQNVPVQRVPIQSVPVQNYPVQNIPGQPSVQTASGTELIFNSGAAKQNPVPRANSNANLPKIPIDKRCDVYSIGATLFHLYTGTRIDRTSQKVLKSGTTEGYLYILNKALQENPQSRFSSAGDMLKALSTIHQKEKVYRKMVAGQTVARLVLLFLFIAGLGLASYGFQRRRVELKELYQSYIEQLSEFPVDGDINEFEEIYQVAVDLEPETIDAYRQKVFYLFSRRDYEETIRFSDEVVKNSSAYDVIDVAEIYYVQGNAYYALEEYDDASDSFRRAISYDGQKADYYGDLAISLAKTGNLEEATDAAKKAEDLGINNAHLSLIRGEIEYAKGNYDTAEEYLKECIRTTTDDYRKMCAYITCGKCISAGGTEEDLKECIDFLKKGVSDVGIEYKDYLFGLLSETYISAYSMTGSEEYASEAIGCLSEQIDSGWAGFSTYNNIVILCTKQGKYAEAITYLDKMEERYPDNYNVFKRRAFLELEIQGKKDESIRDYSDFAKYYHEALDKYQAQSGEKVDPEMDLLSEDYRMLIDGNWLSE